eukprot:TRINITY_DN868_c0_g5_i1.p1 TRINITY_DN868_c0_g5~~TRINITY_DN868_c0_g5_i1.p1  ORF type:complete len:113 (+),score=21.12 TRINITY_DN868_c0_g5_i1:64-402(+)
MSEPAYAKLVGKSYSSLIQGYPYGIGRINADDDPNFLVLNEDMKVSRKHATIEWDSESQSWVVTCVGKNGLHLNSEFVGQHERRALSHKSRLQISEQIIYFLLPHQIDMDSS